MCAMVTSISVYKCSDDHVAMYVATYAQLTLMLLWTATVAM